jgi:hypothetical protein
LLVSVLPHGMTQFRMVHKSVPSPGLRIPHCPCVHKLR